MKITLDLELLARLGIASPVCEECELPLVLDSHGERWNCIVEVERTADFGPFHSTEVSLPDLGIIEVTI